MWNVKAEATSIDSINEAQDSVKGVSQQALEELERAKVSLQSAADERARKDAVRSCVSAMESVIKEFGQNDEIGEATKNLKNAGSWGSEKIVKDGHSIFNEMHRLYPDLRHGAQNCQASSMSLEEAEYWIDRISCFMKYLRRMADKNGVV